MKNQELVIEKERDGKKSDYRDTVILEAREKERGELDDEEGRERGRGRGYCA